MSTEFTDATPLGEARTWLRDQAEAKGAACPCCQQFTKIYKRKINSGMAYALVLMCRAHGTEWQDKTVTLRGVGSAARDESLLRFWGLIEEDKRLREDGGRAGWWRVTPNGVRFVRGGMRVPKHAVIYDSRLLRFEGVIPGVSVQDCLGDRFDLAELLAERAG